MEENIKYELSKEGVLIYVYRISKGKFEIRAQLEGGTYSVYLGTKKTLETSIEFCDKIMRNPKHVVNWCNLK